MSALYWVIFRRHYTPMTDAEHYDGIARSLASGNGFSHVYPGTTLHATAFRPPLFPSVLGDLYIVFGPHVAVGQALNLVLGAAAAAMVCIFVAHIASVRAGLLAGLLFAVYPPLLANNVALLSEPLGMLLLFGCLFAMLRRDPLVVGLLAGALSLTWTSGQAFLIVAAIWIAAKMGWRSAARVIFAGLVLLVPWSIRNEIQVGTPALDTSNGFNLAAVYSPQSERYARGFFIDPAFDPVFAPYRTIQDNEAKWDKTMRDLGLKGLRAHPFRVVAVAQHNLAAILEIDRNQNANADRLDDRNPFVRHVGLLVFPVVTVAGLVGLFINRRREGLQLTILVTGYITALVLVTVEAPRLRGAFDAACCIGTAMLIDALLTRKAQRIRRAFVIQTGQMPERG